MNAALIVACVLASAALLGIVRSARSQGRRTLRIGLQIAAALLLYFSLFPPSTQEDFAADELVVLTPGATPAQLAARVPAADIVALPGAGADLAIERVPDLGTALRRHAHARRLHIVGGGLPSRDRDAASGLVAEFDAAPLPRGVVELAVPAWIPAGHVWRADGRVEGVAGGRVELHDPAGAIVAAQALDAEGRFSLHASAKGEGTLQFALRLFDRDGAHVDAVAVPLAVRSGAPMKILLLAGAPDADLKYLRRWAADAGVALDSRMLLSDGVALSEGAPALDGEALRRADVAIVDERAWLALDAQGRQALSAAVRDGLGLLLRVTGPLPATAAADWAQLGYRLEPADSAAPIRLDRALGLAESGFSFSRRAFVAAGADAAALLRADDASTLVWSRNLGSGRVGLWPLADSYKLSLGGAGAAFGSAWSDVLSAVARARGAAAPTLPDTARVDERAVFCAVADGAAVETASVARSELIVDAATHCAGYWPEAPGWHSLLSGGQSWPFYVRPRDEAGALAAAQTQRATRALLGVSGASFAATASRSLPLPRWPFFLAWLAAAAALWWIERGRLAGEGD